MGFLTGDIKSMLTIKAKPRHDDFTDQFHRIFMVKICMVSSLLLGLNWMKDSITCIIPNTAGISKDYVHQSCWIQGFYIFQQLPQITNRFVLYGIPTDLDHNGINPTTGRLCTHKGPRDTTCEPMKKTFYLQYQYFPFYVACVGLLYYLPYLVYRYVNSDLITLKNNVKSDKIDVDDVITNFFNYVNNPLGKMRIRLVANVFVKMFYIIVNVIAFTATDVLINGQFRNYGREWLTWTRSENTVEFDYTDTRTAFRPAEKLLPTFGLCDVLELGKDVKHQLNNQHRFVCEISQNVLYQYVFVLMWFFFVLGMVVSVLGFILHIASHFQLTMAKSLIVSSDHTRKMYDLLSFRECQYLEYIRRKNLGVYSKLVKKLREDRFHGTLDSKPTNGYIPSHHHPNNPYKDSQMLLQETILKT